MSGRNIEDGFQPKTVNEVLLLNRIRDLRIAGYEKGLSCVAGFRPGPLEKEHAVSYPAPMELRLAVEVESSWKDDRDLFVRCRSYGKDKASLGFQYYIGQHALHHMTPGRAAQMLGDQHQRLIHEIASIL